LIHSICTFKLRVDYSKVYNLVMRRLLLAWTCSLHG